MWNTPSMRLRSTASICKPTRDIVGISVTRKKTSYMPNSTAAAPSSSCIRSGTPAANMPQYAFPAGYTELTFDTTRAIANMLYTGMLAKYPNIRWIMPHMGGVTPFLMFRLCGLDDDPKARERIPDGVAAYLRRLYYDVAQSPSPLALRALLDVADPSHILFGTDYPSARNVEKVMRDTVAAVRTFDGFDDKLRRKVMASNAQGSPALCAATVIDTD